MSTTKEHVKDVISKSPAISGLIDELIKARAEQATKDKTEGTQGPAPIVKALSPENTVLDILGREYDSFSDTEKDIFHEWHKYRVFETENIKKIVPLNTDTHTIVTASGNVCIIRKPLGRILGNVMSKIGAFNKDPDFYEAGSIIFRECRVYLEKAVENNPDELFAVKMACLGATNIVEARIKKN